MSGDDYEGILLSDSDESLTEEAEALLRDPELQEIVEGGRDLRSKIDCLLTVRKTTLSHLAMLKHDTEKSYDKSRKARVAGTAATITGSTLAIIGFGLGFVTFGTSLALTIVGGVLAGSGGVTIAGAEIGNAVVSWTNLKQALAAYNQDIEQTTEVQHLGKRFASLIDSLTKKHSGFSEHPIFTVVKEVVTTGKSGARCLYSAYKLVDAVADIGRSIVTAIDVAKSAAQVGARTAWAGFSTARRVITSIGAAFDVIFIPIDVAVMVKSAYDIHKYRGGKGTSNSSAAKRIGELIRDLEKQQADMEKIRDDLSPDRLSD